MNPAEITMIMDLSKNLSIEAMELAITLFENSIRKQKDKQDDEIRAIDDRVEAEQEARIEAQEYEKDDFSITNLQDND